MVRSWNRGSRALVSVVVATGLLATSTGSGAQLPEVAVLRMTAAPVVVAPGGTATVSVEPADIAAHCPSDLGALATELVGATLDAFAASDLAAALADRLAANGITVDLDDLLDQVRAELPDLVAVNGDLLAPAAELLHLTAFADPVTLEPLLPVGVFDSTTGIGILEVPPGIDPGRHPVIALCLAPAAVDAATLDAIAAEVLGYLDGEQGSRLDALLTELIEAVPEDPEADPTWIDGFLDRFAAELEDLLPQLDQVLSLVLDLVEPRALGVATVCVDDGHGCAGVPEIVRPAVVPPAGRAPGARPVKAAPTFTG